MRRSLLAVEERPADGRPEAPHPVLEDVVVGTAMERVDGGFLADAPGDEDERQVAGVRPDDLECLETGEPRHPPVREHKLGGRVERIDQGGCGLDPHPLRGEPLTLQLEHDELGIDRTILDEDHVELRVADGLGCAMRARFAMRAIPHLTPSR